jgi:GntR family transcriptional regulator
MDSAWEWAVVNPKGRDAAARAARTQHPRRDGVRRLKPGDQLPTVRQLAVALRINANTVAKVYSHLERAGALETRRGVGTFIADRHDSERNQAARTTELRAVALRALADADARGFTAAELRRELQVISKEQQRDHP